MLFLVSALVSDNGAASMTRVRIALPMLLLPIAFALLPVFSKKSYQQLLSIYFYLMVVACLGVLINYGLHYEAMQQRLIVSKAIPTPNGEHIRFSLMINLAVFAGFWLLEQQFYWKKTMEKWLMGTLVLFLIITLHLLSVRIGMVVLYGGLGTTVFYYMLRKKYYVIGIVLLMGIASVATKDLFAQIRFQSCLKVGDSTPKTTKAIIDMVNKNLEQIKPINKLTQLA